MSFKTNSTACHNAYKSLRNEINKNIMYAKRDYYTNCVDRNRNNTKQMWKHINHKSKILDQQIYQYYK
jgi:hypothetical protein